MGGTNGFAEPRAGWDSTITDGRMGLWKLGPAYLQDIAVEQLR